MTRLYESSSGAGSSFGSYTIGTIKGRAAGFDLGVTGNTTRDLHQLYTISTLGRFVGLTDTVGSGSPQDFIYAYKSSSALLDGYTTGSNFAVSRDYETTRDLVTRIEAKWGTSGTATRTRFDYTYDPLYQRRSAKQSGTAFDDHYTGQSYSSIYNFYTYNTRRELESARMYRGDSVPTAPSTPDGAEELPGRRFEYRYDNIGSRLSSGSTGTTSGTAGAGDDDYTPNSLNQYSARENNFLRVAGVAHKDAIVAVTGAALTVKKDNAWGVEIAPGNSGGAVKVTPSVYASLPGTGTAGADVVRTDATKSEVVPTRSQSITYDADGNLKSDGVWTYTYNAENQLVRMASDLASGSGFTRLRLDFKYDYMGRRIEKIVHNIDTSAETTLRFIYDGWNLIAELGTSGTDIQRSYAWGLDLDGDHFGSGGVGALLRITNYSSGTPGTNYYPTFDGNGNVMSLVNGGSGALAAVYEYDPFGVAIRDEVIDSGVADIPFKFSTKYVDAESGYIYYGLRYYSPSLGRFINRDPIEESGGLNLYGFCGNNGVNGYDVLGMGKPSLLDGGDGFASSGGGAAGSIEWAFSTGLVVADPDVTFLRARQDRKILERAGVHTANMSDAQVLDLAVRNRMSNSVQEVGPGTELNGVSMFLIGLSLGMASPLMAIADAFEHPTLLAPLNIAFSTLAGAGAIIGAPASILTGDAFDTYTVGGPGRAYMNGIFTASDVGQKAATDIGAAYLNNNSHYKIGSVGIGDLMQIVLDTFGVVTAPGINAALSSASGTTNFVFHSQGTATGANGLRLIPAGGRSNIDVVGAGGQWFLNATLLGYHSATNLSASRDPVPYMYPVNAIFRAFAGASTRGLSVPNATNKFNFSNHDFPIVYEPHISPIGP